MSFSGNEGAHKGQCINVSDSGLLARLDNPPELWTDGQIEVETEEHFLTIHARVARRQGEEVGFAFLLNSAQDRNAICLLVNSVLDSPLDDPFELERMQDRPVS